MNTQTLPTPRIRPILTTAAYYSAFITLGLTTGVIGPTLPSLAEHTGSRIDEISIIFVASSFGYLLGSLLGGRAYDRLPGHRLVAAMLALIALVLVLVPVVPLLWVLVVVMFFLGTFQGAMDVGCNSLLMWVHGAKVGPFMNGLHFFFGVGAFLSPVVVAQVLQLSGNIHWAYWIFALIVLPNAVWLWSLPSPTVDTTPHPSGSSKAPRLLVSLLVLFFAVYVGAEVGFGNWIFTYTRTLNLADQTVAAYLNSAFWGSFTLGRLIGVGISVRFRPTSILYTDLIGCLASMGVILLWPASSVALWIGVFGIGMFMASVFATMLAYAEQRMKLTGAITGWFLVGGGAGSMFLPWLIGQSFERIGPQSAMQIITIDLVVNLLLLILLTNIKPVNHARRV